jgi:methylated-DNA-protein-cysteine methyltransferase-like protein
MAGSPNAARAVGNILHKNPFFGEVPCHRVVHADGRLAAAFVFGGIGVQKQMLEAEGVTIQDDCVCPMEQYFFIEQTQF